MIELINTAPGHVFGYEFTVSKEEVKALRSAGTLVEKVNLHMANVMASAIVEKHKDNIDMTMLDIGRVYRLELLAFTRNEWIAHSAAIAKLEAEREDLIAQVVALQGKTNGLGQDH